MPGGQKFYLYRRARASYPGASVERDGAVYCVETWAMQNGSPMRACACRHPRGSGRRRRHPSGRSRIASWTDRFSDDIGENTGVSDGKSLHRRRLRLSVPLRPSRQLNSAIGCASAIVPSPPNRRRLAPQLNAAP